MFYLFFFVSEIFYCLVNQIFTKLIYFCYLDNMIEFLIYNIGRFTSLCKIFTYFSIQQKIFSANGAHGTKKFLPTTPVSKDFA